jgi:hypothetical protein
MASRSWGDITSFSSPSVLFSSELFWATSAPQPLYKITLFVSRDTRRDPVASCLHWTSKKLRWIQGIDQDIIPCYSLHTSSSDISCWIGVPSALFLIFTIARGCFLKCVFIVFATPVITLFLPKTEIRCLTKWFKVSADNSLDKIKKDTYGKYWSFLHF